MKKFISMMLAVVMSVSAIAVTSFSAGAVGETITSARAITLGQKYTVQYPQGESNPNYYTKVTLPSDGVLTFGYVRPIETNSSAVRTYANMKVSVCNSSGIEFDSTPYAAVPETIQSKQYKIGLRKGTYYLNFIMSECVPTYSTLTAATIATSFVATSTFEKEINDSALQATPMTYGKAYGGFLGLDNSDDDYYKFTITTPRYVRFTFSSSLALTSTTTNNYIYIQKSTDGSRSSLKYYSPYSYTYKAAWEFNNSVNNSNFRINSAKEYYIDKYIPAGTYYIAISSYDKNNTFYALKASNIYYVTKPGNVTLKKATKRKKTSLQLNWKKASGAKGYQIQYSTKKNFKKAKTKFTTKKSIVLKKLNKKKYFVRIRAYKINNKKKLYGNYTKFTIKRMKTLI